MIDPQTLPPHVLPKIATLEHGCLGLTEKLERARRDLQHLHIERRDLAPREVHDQYELNRESERFFAEGERLDGEIAGQTATCERHEGHLRSEEAIIKACKTWLHQLPATARLETVEGVAGDLESIRARINATEHEIDVLERLPVPSGDLGKRIANHVAALAAKATPMVQGIADGQTLKVLWPLTDHADRVTQSGFVETEANPLLLAALLYPERLAECILQAATASGIPKGERDARLKALKAQLTQALYDEEASLDDDMRSPSAPAWAVLQVRIAAAKKAAA
jgi:hypothetical protein